MVRRAIEPAAVALHSSDMAVLTAHADALMAPTGEEFFFSCSSVSLQQPEGRIRETRDEKNPHLQCGHGSGRVGLGNSDTINLVPLVVAELVRYPSNANRADLHICGRRTWIMTPIGHDEAEGR